MGVAKRKSHRYAAVGSGPHLLLIWLLGGTTIFLRRTYVVMASPDVHPTVSWQDCLQEPFEWLDYTYQGCTTANATGPWCFLSNSLETTNWGYCNVSTIPPPQAEAKGAECGVPSTIPSTPIKVYGCFGLGKNGLVCQPQSRASNNLTDYVPCTLGSSASTNGNSDKGSGGNSKNSAPSGGSPGSRYGSGNAGGKGGNGGNGGPSAGFISGMIFLSILLAAATAVVFVFWNRRRKLALRNKVSNATTAFNNPYRASGAGFSAAGALSSRGSYEAETAGANEFSEQALGSYTVASTYTPALGDELEIQPGDKVTILVEYDDGWVLGINETRGRTKGVFPKHCVEPVNLPSVPDSKRTSSQRYSAT